MSFEIVSREDLTEKVHLFEIKAPKIAKKVMAGHFIILRVDEKGERIPLTIADWNEEKGTISIVFNEVGLTTKKLARLKEGESILNVAGPLGKPAKIDNFGTVVCVVGGYSVATIIPTIHALKSKGNKVISIMRTSSKEEAFGEEELRDTSDEFISVIGEGGDDQEGFALEPLRKLLDSGEKIHRVIAVGPMCMMRFTSLITKQYEIPTVVSLNPIMVDGTGMCGCCRVKIGKSAMFACVHGPEFDGHQVDWRLLMSRRCTYSDEPKSTLSYQCSSCAQW